jgi:signal transduction histidine kinase
MKRLLLFIFVVLIFFPQLRAGNHVADSLLIALTNRTDQDTVRVLLLNEYAYAIFPSNPPQADSLANISLALSDQLGYSAGAARAYYLRSIVKTVMSDFPGATRLAKLSRDLYLELGDEAGQATAYNTLGGVASMQGNHAEALTYHLQALKIREKLGLRGEAAKSYTNIGLAYFSTDSKEEALRNFFKARDIHEKEVFNPVLKASVDNNIGVVYLDMDSLDKALYYFDQSLSTYEKYGIINGMVAIVRNVGHIYKKKGEYEMAATNFRKAIQFYPITGDQRELAAAQKDLGNVFLAMERLDSARIYLSKAASASKQIAATAVELESLQGLYKVARRQGDFESALRHHEEYLEVYQEINANERLQQVEKLKIQYETEKKEADYALLSAREGETEASLQRNNLILALIATIAAFLLIVILVLLRNVSLQKRTNRILTEQKQILESQKAEIQKQKDAVDELSREKDALVGIVAHDLRAPLTRVEGLINIITASGPINEEQQSAADLVYRVTGDGTALIRDLLQVTAAEQVDAQVRYSEFDLNGYMRDLLVGHQQHAKEKNISLELHADAEVNLINTDREILTRILDNLIDNGLKFSFPGSKVEITAEMKGAHFAVAVKDHGPGISKREQPKLFRKFQKLSARPTGGEGSTGLGLSIIKALIEQLKGQIEVESDSGQGATFTVIIPNHRVGN